MKSSTEQENFLVNEVSGDITERNSKTGDSVASSTSYQVELPGCVIRSSFHL